MDACFSRRARGVVHQLAALGLTSALVACSSGGSKAAASSGSSASSGTTTSSSAVSIKVVPGMPPVVDPHNIYSEQGAGMLADAVKGDRELVYVPNGISNDISVIDPK